MKKIGITILLLIFLITLAAILYQEPKTYTYYTNNKFGSSKECFIDMQEYRVCKINGEYKVVELYYYEII